MTAAEAYDQFNLWENMIPPQLRALGIDRIELLKILGVLKWLEEH